LHDLFLLDFEITLVACCGGAMCCTVFEYLVVILSSYGTQ